MTNTAHRIARKVLDAIATHHYRAGHTAAANRYAAAYHRLSH